MSLPDSVYDVHDDTLLLLDALNTKLDSLKSESSTSGMIRLLDMGAGSGHLGFEAFKKGNVNVTLSDKNPDAVKHMKQLVEGEDLPIDVFESDLFESIPSDKCFDLIVFNTPYLPFDSDADEYDMSIHGGKQGNEVALRFLERSKEYLAEDGSLLVLFSSLSTPEDILKKAGQHGFSYSKVAMTSLFFERLFVYEFKRKDDVS